MGYRGEDAAAHGNRGRQRPWGPPSGTPGGAGAWGDGPQGYPEPEEGYPPADGGGYGYGPDGTYPGYAEPGGQQYPAYPAPAGQYHSGYGQEQYEQYDDGYGHGQPAGGGYAGPQGYSPAEDGYGYGPGTGPGYGPEPAQSGPGYPRDGGYPESAGFGPPAPYGPGPHDQAAYGTGGYPAMPGGHPAEDAGNDWYGGQPAAASGASFADTGSYRLNGSVIDEYGTGPRGTLGTPARGLPPGPGTNPQSVATTRQQQRLEKNADFRGPGQAAPAVRPGRPAQGQGDGYPTSGGFGAAGPGYDGGFDEPETDSDPYQDQYPDEARPDGAGGPGRAKRGRGGGRKALRGRPLIFAALGVVALGIIVAVAYTFVFKSGGTTGGSSAEGPLPTGSTQPSQQACQQQLGTYCHIESASDDPQPLSVAELYPPEFTNEKDKTSYSLVSTKLDKTCSNAVIGSDLIKQLKSGKCTQVVRASYVSGDNKIMGTIGVVNLGTTNEAHYAGKVVGKNDFIAPLTSAKGVASKLGNGTGVVQAEFKGHYLILTWAEYVDGTHPTTTAQDKQLEQFSNDLVAGTANIDLSQRMVTGAPASASVSPSSSAKASASASAKASASTSAK